MIERSNKSGRRRGKSIIVTSTPKKDAMTAKAKLEIGNINPAKKKRITRKLA